MEEAGKPKIMDFLLIEHLAINPFSFSYYDRTVLPVKLCIFCAVFSVIHMVLLYPPIPKKEYKIRFFKELIGRMNTSKI